MRRHLFSVFSACVATAFFAGLSTTTHAAMITVLNDNGNLFLDSTNEAGEIDFDIIWNNNLPVWLQIDVDSNDGNSLALSGAHINLSGIPWTDFHLELEGEVTWETIGQITPAAGTTVNSNDLMAWLFFNPPIADGDQVVLGTVGSPSATDWYINISDIPDGSFQLHIHPSTAVPEPSSVVLLGIGSVVLVGYGLRRKRKMAA